MKQSILTILATTLCATSAVATETATQSSKLDQKLNEWLPSVLKLYDEKTDGMENRYIQKLSLNVRAQYQWGSLDPNGDHNNGRSSNNEYRRFRIGGNALVFDNYKVETMWNVGGVNSYFKNGERTRTSTGLESLSVARNVDQVNIQVGHFKPAYMGEYRTSSSKIKTIERSAIVNTLAAGTIWGASLKSADKDAQYSWQVGGWIQGTDEQSIWEMPEFNSTTSMLFGASIARKMDNGATLRLDYMHSFYDTSKALESGIDYDGAGATDVLAISYEYNKDKMYFLGEFIGAFNVIDGDAGAENLFGLVLLPSYHFTPQLEGVFRYQLSVGSNAAGTYSRYYNLNSTYSSTSDLMQGFYFGVNYYMLPESPHTAKVMLGAEYINSHGTDSAGNKGYNGWSFSAALRVNF